MASEPHAAREIISCGSRVLQEYIPCSLLILVEYRTFADVDDLCFSFSLFT